MTLLELSSKKALHRLHGPCPTPLALKAANIVKKPPPGIVKDVFVGPTRSYSGRTPSTEAV